MAHLNLPDFIPKLSPPVVFEPIPDENDELIQAIEQQAEQNDDKWQLEEVYDEAKLEKFWDDVIREVGAEVPETHEESALY